MSLLDDTIASIKPPDDGARRAAAQRLDSLTKPRGSLGYLEELVCRYAAIRHDPAATTGAASMLVFVADHGIAQEGVSAYPQAVTEQMLRNFARGGAAISVLARHYGYQLKVVDMGVATDTSGEGLPGVIYRRIGAGTRNFMREPAMNAAQAARALEAGIEIVSEADRGRKHAGRNRRNGYREQHRGGRPAERDNRNRRRARWPDAGLVWMTPDGGARSRSCGPRSTAIAIPSPMAANCWPRWAVLRSPRWPGYAWARRRGRSPRSLTASSPRPPRQLADKIAPGLAAHLFFSHRSAEGGHNLVLEHLGARPILDLDLRLGEGTGAAIAISVLQAALAAFHGMATFAGAGVAEKL